jgi:hypothetical protein
VGGILSELIAVTRGMEQGSVLGPLLFSKFINDIVAQIDKISGHCHRFSRISCGDFSADFNGECNDIFVLYCIVLTTDLLEMTRIISSAAGFISR